MKVRWMFEWLGDERWIREYVAIGVSFVCGVHWRWVRTWRTFVAWQRCVRWILLCQCKFRWVETNVGTGTGSRRYRILFVVVNRFDRRMQYVHRTVHTGAILTMLYVRWWTYGRRIRFSAMVAHLFITTAATTAPINRNASTVQWMRMMMFAKIISIVRLMQSPVHLYMMYFFRILITRLMQSPVHLHALHQIYVNVLHICIVKFLLLYSSIGFPIINNFLAMTYRHGAFWIRCMIVLCTIHSDTNRTKCVVSHVDAEDTMKSKIWMKKADVRELSRSKYEFRH